MSVDPVTVEVIRNGFSAAAEEMNATLVRTAYSPNIKERRDCSCAIFDADGAMVSQAENIPVHLGAMPFSVAAAIEAYPLDRLQPGDGILLNDPFRGGAHLPDLTLVTPVFASDTVVGFVANRAHHADVGGTRAGSIAADATEIYQEGIRIPPVRAVRDGAFDEELLQLVLANTRSRDERLGDLRAQLAANRTGVERFVELGERHGFGTLAETIAEINAYSERRMRQEIAAIPDGEFTCQDALEGDGRGNGPLPIVANVTVSGEDLVVDFTGTAPQTAGAINAVEAVTVSATYYAIRVLTDPDIPPNAGCYRPVSVHAPTGTIVNAEPPAAVVGGNLETSQRVVDTIFGAFATHVPERVPAASQGTMNNVTFGGVDPETDREFAFYETQAGGHGARVDHDGADAVQVHMTNTMNTPIEVLESAYPLRVRRYALRPDSAGAGAYRGGLGLRRDFEVCADGITCSLLGERRETGPAGIAGGEPGEPGADVLIREGESESVHPKSTHELEAGTVVSIRTPGGGGYGDPGERDPDLLARDRRLGKLTDEAIRTDYGRDPEELDPDC